MKLDGCLLPYCDMSRILLNMMLNCIMVTNGLILVCAGWRTEVVAAVKFEKHFVCQIREKNIISQSQTRPFKSLKFFRHRNNSLSAQRRIKKFLILDLKQMNVDELKIFDKGYQGNIFVIFHIFNGSIKRGFFNCFVRRHESMNRTVKLF